VTEAHWIAERAALRCLACHHPDWTQEELATCLGRSCSWVKKWLGRLDQAPPDDLSVLQSRSRARHTPPPAMPAALVERILAIRDEPPEHLTRVPGPRTILYYLPRDPLVQAQGLVPPRSTTTVWKVLRQQGRIVHEPRRRHQPVERPAPLEEIQMDFKDASTVPPEPDGKRQHAVEVCNFVDAGTSIALWAQVSADFHAETALVAVLSFLRQYGLPRRMTFDRDPRWVGSASGRDFPSALVRLLRCLGIDPQVCPPHRPDHNAFVERYHRTYNEECLQVERPRTAEAVREVTDAFLDHYNWVRPNQARSCGNVPPRVACPTLPTLPQLPEGVDPDRWLEAIDGQAFARTVQPNGNVLVDLRPYYIRQALAGRQVVLVVRAAERIFDVWYAHERLKQVPIKGLSGQRLPFEQYAERMQEEARSDYRRWLQAHRHIGQAPLWTAAGSG